MTYKSHINELCKKHKIRKFVRKGITEQAYLDDRIIHIHPLKNLRSYIVALHEIGHIINRNKKDKFLMSEKLAWEWAKKNSLVWNDQTEKLRVKCLNSYVECAKEYLFISKEIDKLNKRLQDLYERWQGKS
jgi:hypothetical protein